MVKNISVFFPVFNEEKNIEGTVKKAITTLERLKIAYEIILVNDGSSDKTGQIAETLAQANSKIKVIYHQQNLGYGEALKSGFYNAKYDIIVYNDGDGQFDFAQVIKFFPKLEDADLIIGYRLKRRDSPVRLFFAKGWALALFLFFGLRLKDVDCGFKMIKKKVLNQIPRLESTRGGMINAELAIKVKRSGFRIAQVGVDHFPRIAGKPTGANLNVILTSLVDLFKLWWKIR